jgi:hypothetical protein
MSDAPYQVRCVVGKTRALLVAGVDDRQLALLQRFVEAEDVVAGDAEDVWRSCSVKGSSASIPNSFASAFGTSSLE